MATTNYPGSLDAYPVPNNGDTISVADHWLGPAVIGIETELGTDPAGSHANVKDRLDQVDSAMGFKNRIIGGNFSTNPWQRGTSFTNLGSGGSAAYGPDRFGMISNDLSGGAYTLQRTADSPTIAEAGVYSKYCVDIDCTTAYSGGSTLGYAQFYQYIEGYNVSDLGFGQSGTRYVTLSFWHKHTKTGTNLVAIKGAGFTRTYQTRYTQTVSNTWEKAEVTFPIDTTGSYDYENSAAFLVMFHIVADKTANFADTDTWIAGNKSGTSSNNQVNNLDSTSNNFKIALVQLEAGDKATRFETRSVGQEKELCLRYYERRYFSAAGYGQGSTFQVGATAPWFPKRANPTASSLSFRVGGTNNYSGTTYGNLTVYSPNEGIFQSQAAATGHTEVLGSYYELKAEL